MRRTQLYLDEELWSVLRIRAREKHTTVSELVRGAVRERYLGNLDQRKKAMRAFVGMRKSRPELESSEEIVRDLRRGGRIEKLNNQ